MRWRLILPLIMVLGVHFGYSLCFAEEPEPLAEFLEVNKKRHEILMGELNTIGRTHWTKPNITQVLYESCYSSKDDKLNVIADRYLDKKSTALTTTDSKGRLWNIDQLYRDVFREGSPVAKTDFSEKCLYDLYKIALFETSQRAVFLNSEKKCFDPEKNIAQLADVTAPQPPTCDDNAWATVKMLATTVKHLQESINQHEKAMNDKIRAGLDSAPKTLAGCLNCLEKDIHNQAELNVSSSVANLSQSHTEIKGVACCQLLKSQKRASSDQECRAQMDPETSWTDFEFQKCATQLFNGLLEGIEALNPQQLVEALPEIGELMQTFLTSPSKLEALALVGLGIAKGVAGYDENLVSCLNNKARAEYACYVSAHSATVLGGAAAMIRLIRSLTKGLKSLESLGNATAAVMSNRYVKSSIQVTKSTYDRIDQILARAGIRPREYTGRAIEFGGQKLNSLAEKFPATVGRAVNYFHTLGEVRQAAAALMEIEVKIAAQRAKGADVSGLLAQKVEIVTTLQEAQSSTAGALRAALSARAMGFVNSAVRTAAPGIPAGAQPLEDHVNATSKTPLHSEGDSKK